MQYITTFPLHSLSWDDFIAVFVSESGIYVGAYGVSKLSFNAIINNTVTACQVNFTRDNGKGKLASESIGSIIRDVSSVKCHSPHTTDQKLKCLNNLFPPLVIKNSQITAGLNF